MKLLKQFFFPNINVYEFFSDLERKIVVICWWISNRLSKRRFFSSRGTFSGRMFLFWKNLQKVGVFIRILAELFQNFGEKGILTEKGQHGCHHCFLRFQRDFLGICFPETNQMQKHFRNWSGTSLTFFEKSRQIREKCITASRWFLLRKNICFFGAIIVYNCFSVIERNFVGLWHSNFNTIGKFAFFCV